MGKSSEQEKHFCWRAGALKTPHQYATGIEYVLVNGQLVVARGKHTGARPGKVIYGPGYGKKPANP